MFLAFGFHSHSCLAYQVCSSSLRGPSPAALLAWNVVFQTRPEEFILCFTKTEASVIDLEVLAASLVGVRHAVAHRVSDLVARRLRTDFKPLASLQVLANKASHWARFSDLVNNRVDNGGFDGACVRFYVGF